VPLDEVYASQWVWRLSVEQWNAMAALPNHGQGYAYTGYKQGADPSTYWFVFEDQGPAGGGDKDYWDMMVRIHVSETELTITPHTGIAGYNFSLAMGEGAAKKVLIKDMKAHHEIPYPIQGNFGLSSYGMNGMAGRLLEGGGKLLAIDYEKTSARGSDFDQADPWLEDPKLFPVKTVRNQTIPVFFRHFDKCNALLTNGSVRPLAFDDISIYSATARERYWNPDSR
jgi:hypothetical protein